jgi:hypothetical protein
MTYKQRHLLSRPDCAASPIRRLVVNAAIFVIGAGVALALAAPADATPGPGQPCDSPGRFIGRASYRLTDPWFVCWGTHVWVPYEPHVKVTLGSPCNGNTVPGLFGSQVMALVDGSDGSGNLYYAWCDQGVYQTPSNYPMTQSGPVPVPM